MYFDLTDDQKAISETVSGLLRDCLPEDKAVAIFDEAKLDRSIWKKVNELGLGGILVSEADGGSGLDLLTLAAVEEQMGRVAASAPVSFNALAAWLVSIAGNKRQKEVWLDALMSGQKTATFALEETGGFLPPSWRLAGETLSGFMPLVSWGAEADLIIVGLAGGGLGLVDGSNAGLKRVEVLPVDQSRPLANLECNDVEYESLSTDTDIAEQLVDAICVLYAADACGAGVRCLALATEYAKTRKQFGQFIGSFQGLKHQLANMAAEMEPCRYLVWYAAHAWNAMPGKQSYLASLAKFHVTETAVRTARGCVEAHGGIGYTWEYPLHIYLKRAMFDRTALGLPGVHRARAASLADW